MRIIGFDPGLRLTGWGVVEVSGHKLRHIANGVCRSGEGGLAERLAR
ncbi:MAG: crossover junction endodeoxyribonuclease RuvC, partial [Pseudomonadota bacterium]